MNQIARFIIKQVQEKSSGFQWTVSYKTIEKIIGQDLSTGDALKIKRHLERMKEVADVELDEYGFDVVLYTDYAPNYDSKETEQ